MMALEQEI